jgi:hypothetical protein
LQIVEGYVFYPSTNIKERIWLSWQEYSVLEEKMEYNEYGWSKYPNSKGRDTKKQH